MNIPKISSYPFPTVGFDLLASLYFQRRSNGPFNGLSALHPELGQIGGY